MKKIALLVIAFVLGWTVAAYSAQPQGHGNAGGHAPAYHAAPPAQHSVAPRPSPTYRHDYDRNRGYNRGYGYGYSYGVRPYVYFNYSYTPYYAAPPAYYYNQFTGQWYYYDPYYGWTPCANPYGY